ncbi:MAG: efflux system, outer rane lipoprotein, NodT [Burkholderiaceae bacterium]|nr:efflux system, outer rane lipoprotein, NodT [Burkholderiaceae bacterium]
MKRQTTFWLTALAAAMLGGCALPAVGPDYQAPELSLPSTWMVRPADNTASAGQPSNALASLAKWWRQLQDPQLDHLIDEALAGSLDLQLAQARLRQARAGRDQAISGLFPTVTASGVATRSKTADVIAPTSTRTVYDAGFDAAWEIDIFGGTRRGIEAATADQQASEASLNNARVSLVAEVAQNYIELRAYQQRLEIAQRNLASQTETLQITEWRYQAGLVGSSDVEQAKTNREQTRAGIPDLEVGLTAAENRLAVLLGKNPGSLHEQLKAQKPLPALPASVAAGIPSDVLRQRPDLVAAERTLAAETARVGQKLAKRFPSLKLGESFGWQAYSLSALGTAGTLARAVTGTLAATLFDGGNLRSAVEIQSAVQEQALISYQKSVLLALEEVENGLKSYAVGRERVDARRGAAEAARNAAQLARNMYQSGLADFQKVLETERTLLSAEDNLSVAEAGMRTSLVKLYKALGGGWEQGKDVAAETGKEKS